jgi:hypothetical protein
MLFLYNDVARWCFTNLNKDKTIVDIMVILREGG